MLLLALNHYLHIIASRSTRGSTWDLALFASWSNGTLEQMSPTSTQICRCPRFFIGGGRWLKRNNYLQMILLKNWTWIFDYFISGALKLWNHVPCCVFFVSDESSFPDLELSSVEGWDWCHWNLWGDPNGDSGHGHLCHSSGASNSNGGQEVRCWIP